MICRFSVFYFLIITIVTYRSIIKENLQLTDYIAAIPAMGERARKCWSYWNFNKTRHKYYRPISNLPFLSKLLQKVVQVCIQAFFDSNGLMPNMHSAYRRFHSSDTAVTKVVNDLLLAADSGQMSALCLLDLTAARL